MAGHIWIVQISHPGPPSRSQGRSGPPDGDGDAYWRCGLGAQLSSMYGELLGLEPLYIGYHKLVHSDGRTPEIGFEYSPLDPPPRWPDPDRPQQIHLDIAVDDLAAAERLAASHGARVLRRADEHLVLADPFGHPFCLYPGGSTPGRIVRVVIDCFSPRALAAFYEELLDLHRTLDTVARVEIAGDEGVELAFQHSTCQAPRWPDPAFPAQLHLDLAFEDPSVREVAERLGAMYRPTPGRPDHVVYADPAGHPFCLGLGAG
jgi:catechol 2,3-dioxygenase-like lactoylglutathione lyase family enzyme